MLVTDLVVKTIGGLGLFVLGMTMMSAGLKMSAGKRIKKILSAVSSNRVIGCITGAGVTAMIQSSSATTVIIIGFVNAGLISLQQAIGIILGANVGTTMTAQLIAFKLSDAAMPAIAVGVAMKLFVRRKQALYWGEVLLGFGLVFLGMVTMKNGLAPLKGNPNFLQFLTAFSPDTTAGLFLSVLVGAIITIAVQSSSATIGLTMAMASQGLIPLPGAIALVLGENIGTTITAELATLGSRNVNAVRAARAHTMFNILGVSVMIVIFPFFIKIVEMVTILLGTGPVEEITENGDLVNIARYIANGHTIFNVLNAIFFLFTLKWLAKVATLMSPKGAEDDFYRLPEFGERLINVPIAMITEIRSEILRMAYSAKRSFIKTLNQLEDKNYRELSKWKDAEAYLDEMQQIIMSSLVRLYQSDLSESESKEISSLMRMTNNLERIGDSIENIAHSIETLIEEKIELSSAAKTDLHHLKGTVLNFIELITDGIKSNNSSNFMKEANILEDTIDTLREEMRQKHINRIKSEACGFEQGLIFLNILSSMEKIGDYCFNIAYSIADKRYYQ